MGLRLVRGSIVLAACVLYFGYVFRLPDGEMFRSGLSDWIDPYFINYLLEHWHHSLWTWSNPTSPPMYFPVRGTLGYSHGLILFAPFYLLVRPFLHPFQAYNTSLFLILTTGAVCLYVIFRRFLRLGFIEALLLSALFFTSPNVIEPPSAIWTQRLSVFVIPPILLLTLYSARRDRTPVRPALGWLSGLCLSLLLIQDFYTAAFAVLVSGLFLIGALVVAGTLHPGSPQRQLAEWWKHDRTFLVSFGMGALIGCVVFLRLYLAAYHAHPSFPRYQLANALTKLTFPHVDWKKALRAYPSLRSFETVLAVGVAACLPGIDVSRTTRGWCLWFVCVSAIVLLIPLQFNESSIWAAFIAPLPGFSAIRDPKRVIEVYELAATLLTAWFLAHLPRRSVARFALAAIVLLLICTNWNRHVFQFGRPITVFARWVEAPLAIDRSCSSFFINGASADYMARSSNMWSLYAMDAMFISLRTGIPTLNGYSAWWPDGWLLSNPQNPDYAQSVAWWVARNGLRNVCVLDIDARTMRPYAP